MSNASELKINSVNSSTEEFWRNFEWGPYQVDTEDKRDNYISRDIFRRVPTQKVSSTEEFWRNFEWGPCSS
jgi:hypothetical protein